MIPLLIKAASSMMGEKKETSKISSKVKDTTSKTTPTESKKVKKEPSTKAKPLDKSKINELSANSSAAAKAANELAKEIVLRQNDEQKAPTGLAKSSDTKAQQQENRTKAFNSQIVDAVESIAASQETIAQEVEDTNKKVQTDEEESKTEEQKSFIGKAVEGISKDMGEGGSLGSMITMGIMAVVGGLVAWWTASGGPGDVGLMTWLWTAISDGASKLWGIISDSVAANGGWWETIKDALYLGLLGVSKVVQFHAWVVDTAMQALFGDGWQATKDAFSEKWKAVTEWWDEVSSMGIGNWIYKQLYDSLGGRIGGDTFGIDLPEPSTSVAKTDLKVTSNEKEEEAAPKPVPGTPKYKTKKQEAFYKVAMKLPPEERAEWIKKYDDDMNIAGGSSNVKNVKNVSSKNNISNSMTNKVNNNVSNTKNNSKVSNSSQDVSKYSINKQQTNIKAVSNGTVEKFQTSNNTKTITVRNEDGSKTIYSNVNSTVVKPGQKIVAGTDIATTNNTKSSNHVTVKNSSKTVNNSNSVSNSSNENNSNNTSKNNKTTNIASSSVVNKSINIKSIPVPEKTESGMSIAELTYISEVLKAQSAQISKLSSSTNTGTLLQTKVSV